MSDKSLFHVKIRSYFSLGPRRGLQARQDEAGHLVVEVAPGDTVESLFRILPMLETAEGLDDWMFFIYVNGREATLDRELQPGDVIDFHLPAMGG